MTPGKNNALTDIDGLRVGNAENLALKSGTTVIVCDQAFPTSVAVHGGAPGTRDTELLQPENSVQGADALVLSGGSAFGLDAASGVQAWLRKQGRGFTVGPVTVPIVPGAILFDLINGGDKDWGQFSPYRDLGWTAAESASVEFEIGSVGAGTGALVAGMKGGLGTASLQLENGIKVAALFAVNAVGSPLIADTRHFHAAPFEKNREFGGYGFPEQLPDRADALNIKFREAVKPNANTTIGVVATDAKLTKAEVKRLAIAAHDGIARAIWPAHTPMDGDLVFAIATGGSEIQPDASDWMDLSSHSASVTARAIARGVYEATPQENDIMPVYRDREDL